MLGKFMLKIKRRETRFYSLVYDLMKVFLSFNLPTIKPIHLPLYYVDDFTKLVIKRLIHICWSIPLFKARCQKVGKNLSLPNGIPLIVGSHLRIFLGDNVTIGRSTIGSSKVFDDPVLRIGDNTSIGYGTTISVAKEVIIGNHCLISGSCLMMDSDDHPISPQKRLLGLPVDRGDVRPVKIGNNVWIGANVAILKGVTIGDNSVIAAHSVVTTDVKENCIYAGNPAKLIENGIDKSGQ
ncbi:acyltransferase [Candidatus Bathyarchaeota archaeon]|nr:acyltransferase [Candidatus Bathyarchaeota archaeon]